MDTKYEGIIASSGIAMGKVYLFTRQEIVISDKKIQKSEVEAETKKVLDAIQAYINDLDNRKNESEEQKKISDAHKELLSDPYFSDTISSKISSDLKNAEQALNETVNEMVEIMSQLEDEYLKERAADYKDIGYQVMFKLKGIVPKDLHNLSEKSIVVSKELTPSDTSTMDKKNVIGFATDLGGKTSHTSIIAQTLDIPALVGMGTISEKLKGGEFAIIDGDQGFLIVNPTDEEISSYKGKIKELSDKKERLKKVKDSVATTKDNRTVEVSANIGNIKDLEIAIENGCDGVGLFRTEFLYMENDHFPKEDEQFEVYKKSAELLKGKPIIIRTLDIGGDKGLNYFDFPKEDNPFLGYRAIRFCLDKEDIFKTQLRAILRASYYGNIKIMLPFVISVDEIKRSREILEGIKKDLDKENIPYDKDIDLGIMVETPASVMMADKLIKYSDFFSIGTNDLTQYVLAVDRGNENISHLYNSYNPAVLRAVKHVIDESHKAGKWTGMCGQFASDTKATKLLLGLGLDEFSGSSSKLAEVKYTIMNSTFNEEEKFALEVLDMESTKDIEDKIVEHNK